MGLEACDVLSLNAPQFEPWVHEHKERVLKQEPITDLARYGIERNPGPTFSVLTLIQEYANF